MTVPGLDYLDRVKPRPAPKNTLAMRAVSHKPTEAMRAEARRGLEWRRQHGRGGTAVGVARARDIANGRNLPLDTVKRMVSYFARHEIDKQGEGWSPGEDGYPSAGRIAWALWGGDAGRSWANSIVDAAEERYNPDQPRDENGRWTSTGATVMDVVTGEEALVSVRAGLMDEANAAAAAEPWLYGGGAVNKSGKLKQHTASELEKRMQDVGTDSLIASTGSEEMRGAIQVGRGVTDPYAVVEAVRPGWGDRLRNIHVDSNGTPVVFDRLKPVVLNDVGSVRVALVDPDGTVYDVAGSAIHGSRDGFMRVIGSTVAQSMRAPIDPVATENIERVVRVSAVSHHVRQWAESSNDHNPTSLQAQITAEREFGLKNTVKWDVDKSMQEAIAERAPVLAPVQSRLLRAMYDRTQEQLAKAGVTEITVARGMGLNRNDADRAIGSTTVTMRPMSSWTTNIATSDDFAFSQAGELTSPNPKAVRVVARVPASQVLSMPGTGYGCLEEYEVVLLGGEMGASTENIPWEDE